MIEKEGKRFVPCGSTVLEEGDHLLILTDKSQSDKVRSMFISEPCTENPGP
jgi:Trk K+ transport system NAD-binding subunit